MSEGQLARRVLVTRGGSGDTLEFSGALSVASLEACLGAEEAEAHLEDMLIPSGGGF